MKIIDRLSSIVARGESVASDEIQAVVPAARNFFPKWKGYGLTAKIFAVAIPVLTVGVLYFVGIDALQVAARHVFRGGDRPVLTQDALKPLQDSIKQLRADLSDKASKDDLAVTIKNSSDALAQTFKAAAPSMLEFKQLQDDVRQLQTERAAAEKKAAQITTGSIKPKKKKPAPAKPAPSLTDPSTWTIYP